MILLLSLSFVWAAQSLTVFAANYSATWSDFNAPVVVSNGQNLYQSGYNDFLRNHESITGDLACEQETLPLGSLDSGFGSYPGCWYKTPLGLIEQGGSFVKPKGQPYAGLVNNTISRLLPTPDPDVFVEITNPSGDYSTFYLNFRTAADDQMVPTDPNWSYPFYSWKSAALHSLELPDGSAWAVSDNLIASQIGYSNNGEYMSIWDDQGFIVVVNLKTFTTRTIFVEPTQLGDKDYATTTMTDDGRYLAVGIFGKQERIFDLSSCTGDPRPQVVGEVDCATRFLGAALDSFTSGAIDLSVMPHFYSDDLLGSYAECPPKTPGFADYCEYLFRAPNTARTNYIALGDSYASGEGEGNSNFYPETKVQNLNMCHLARNSYPFLIGRDLRLDSTHSVACSGAKIVNVLGNGVFDNSLTNPNRTNQYSNKIPGSTLGGWIPGFWQQIKYVSDKKPSVVTISMSGNDVGFSDIIKSCLGAGTCYSSYEDRLELVGNIDDQFPRLVEMYEKIKLATVPDAKIYVIGYPSVIKSLGDCGLRQPISLNAQETVFANELVNYLDQVIQQAADEAGVAYVNAENVFDGHRLCEGDAGKRAVNGLTVGHDTGVGIGSFKTPRILSNGSFHPTVYGHQLLAKAVEKQTRNFTEPMPRPNYSIQQPLPDDSILLLSVEKSGRAVNEVSRESVANNIEYKGQNIDIRYSPQPGYVRVNPFAQVYVKLHSKPTQLGVLKTDASGNISGSVAVPSSVPTGFHVLNLYVAGQDGKTQDIKQTIYVAASPTDYDGDGVPNSKEPCLIFESPDLGGENSEDYSCEPSISTSESPQSTVSSVESTSTQKPIEQSGTAEISPGEVNQASTGKEIVSSSRVLGDSTNNESKKASSGDSTNWLLVIAAAFVAILLMFLLRLRYAKR